uniref:ATP synthase F0 subunit 8 n=1 Tax=Abraximorpha esta TaxID=2983380 RepID=UPI002551D7D6|nr:ATP synthase F0 subunit 8 [Abraximorpha esta]WGM81055.1 ATP synthase F0 subunit 8 [Abraximorpha esta]
MPQMMPINWILSFFMFILIFILYNILNYYIFNINNKSIKNNLKKSPMKFLLWKW